MRNIKESIDDYLKKIKKYNEGINIYSQNAYDKLAFHVEDSLNVADLIGDQPLKVADLGSGAGFPSILIALKNPQNQVLAIEAKNKKCNFLKEIKQELNLTNFEVLAEDINQNLPQIKADIFTAKAFKKLNDLLPLFEKKRDFKKLIVPISKNQIDEVDKKFIPRVEIIQVKEFWYLIYTQ
ncbi:MAG: 16S rRNA (guanine(527)-N(7))-methyltransferase RsmG [Candidatus Margulisiibacteriota bacterium]|jgi:16S rRNA (guanine527-N7)-methyltransferase